MVRIIRWAISISLLQGAALLVLARLVPGFEIDTSPGVLVVALVFTLTLMVSWPLFYLISARIHPALFPVLSLVLSGALVLFVSDTLSIWHVADASVENVQTGIVLTLGLTASYTLFGSLFSLRDGDAYDWFVTRRIRRTFHTNQVKSSPGTLFIEIDGLSEPLLKRALNDGWMPNLARWQSSGSHTLNAW